MWVARDKNDDTIWLFKTKPYLHGLEWQSNDPYFNLNEKDIFGIKVNDEPVEVQLIPFNICNIDIMSDKTMSERISKLPIQCQFCSHGRCLEPKGAEVCEHYNERIKHLSNQ